MNAGNLVVGFVLLTWIIAGPTPALGAQDCGLTLERTTSLKEWFPRGLNLRNKRPPEVFRAASDFISVLELKASMLYDEEWALPLYAFDGREPWDLARAEQNAWVVAFFRKRSWDGSAVVVPRNSGDFDVAYELGSPFRIIREIFAIINRAAPYRRLRILGLRPSFELRVFEAPAFSVRALWLHGKQDYFVIAEPTGFRYLDAARMQEYVRRSQTRVLKAVSAPDEY